MKDATGEDLVEVEIERVVKVLDRSIVVEKDGEEAVVGNNPIDNLDELLEAFEAKKPCTTLTVPRWLARSNGWPEAEE